MLVIDKLSRIPIYEQIEEGIKREIATGILKPGDQLPSIRELSVILSTNPNTVQKAIMSLDRAGIIVSTQGRGSFVAKDVRERIKDSLGVKLDEIKAIASSLKDAGVDSKEIIDAIKSVYKSK